MRRIVRHVVCRFRDVSYFCVVLLIAVTVMQCQMAPGTPKLVQEPLGYPEGALEPFMSSETLRFHYGKHHAGYVKTANRLLQDMRFSGKTPVEVLALTVDSKGYAEVFNNVAQAMNHAFFWKCMKPDGGGEPKGALAGSINDAFGSFRMFKSEVMNAAHSRFGSGWVWLVLDDGALKVLTTANADTPLAHGLKPLLAIDLWEHAYYLDYQNRRAEFVEKVLDHLINWEFVASEWGRLNDKK